MNLEKITDRWDEVHDLASLDKAFKKIAAKKAENQQHIDYANAEIKKITEWLSEVTKPNNSDIEYIESLITNYHKRVLEEYPKKKTLSTPNGKSKSRTTKKSPYIKDGEALLRAVKRLGDNDFVDVKESVKWGYLKSKIHVVELEGGEVVFTTDDGQVLEGLDLKEEETDFKMEVGE